MLNLRFIKCSIKKKINIIVGDLLHSFIFKMFEKIRKFIYIKKKLCTKSSPRDSFLTYNTEYKLKSKVLLNGEYFTTNKLYLFLIV